MKTTILVVDDEEDILTSIAATLREMLGTSAEIKTARTGEDARALLEDGPRYDMVITDERMPGLRGIELLEWLRLTSPRTLRVLMTAYRDPRIGQDAVNRASAHLMLYKPFDLREALPSLRAALEEKARRDLQERSLARALRTFQRLSRGSGMV